MEEEDESVEDMMSELLVDGGIISSPVGRSSTRRSSRMTLEERSFTSDSVMEDAASTRLKELWTEEKFVEETKMMEEVKALKLSAEAMERSGRCLSEMWTPDNFGKFTELIEEVGVLKLSGETTVVKLGGLGLENLQECVDWVGANSPGEEYGLIMDPLILMDRLHGNIHLDQMTQLKSYETQAKLNIKTAGEASSLTALGYPRPWMFHEGQPLMSCDQNTSRLSKLAKHGIWKTGSQGIRNHIMDRLGTMQSSITGDINHAYGINPKGVMAKTIALMGLTSSVAFVTQLVNYVDSLFEKLHIHSKFTVDTAWSLTMQILDRICEDFVCCEGWRVDWNVRRQNLNLRRHHVVEFTG